MSKDGLSLRHAKDLTKCIVCQKSKKGEKLTSNANGRTNLIAASTSTLNDDLLTGLLSDDHSKIQYHLSCYKKYKLQAGRRPSESGDGYDDNNKLEEEDILLGGGVYRSKRRKSDDIGTLCIICNQKKVKGETKLYRICDNKRAETFISAYRFNQDDVFSRCSIYTTAGDVFAADLVSHGTCMNKYLLKYQRDINELVNVDIHSDPGDDILMAFDYMLSEIDLTKNGYTISSCRDIMNLKLVENEVVNKLVKKMLIKRFGEKICFTYPSDQKQSQMFYMRNILESDIVETLRAKNIVKDCAEVLRQECLQFDFNLENSYCDADDLAISLRNYQTNRPSNWEVFFNNLFPSRSKSIRLVELSDVIFQIIYYHIHNSSQRTPIHVSIAECIHDICRSKQIIQILNRLGLCLSYNEVERIDSALAQRLVERAGDFRVPLPPFIQGEGTIHGAMDNFDHDEKTRTRTSGSHDTILILFKNSTNQRTVSSVSKKGPTIRDSSYIETVECQKQLKSGYNGVRGKIPPNFVPGHFGNTQNIEEHASKKYFIWVLARYFKEDTNVQSVPSFPATNSLLIQDSPKITITAQTPILPFPATEYDTVFTCMTNFQDVLKQMNLPYGPLWSDEGVYHIAKELQLLNPDLFQNIFLGLGGFHTEKIVLACLGTYLKQSGIEQILVENEIFGPVAVNSVMSGADYALGKRGMSLIAEAMSRLYISAFESNNKRSISYRLLKDHFSTLQTLFSTKPIDPVKIHRQWDEIYSILATYDIAVKEFDDLGIKESQLFAYWHMFIFKLYPILRDLTTSFREGNWNLHLSAIRRALPLFFAFDRTNYSRWTPLYFEDCINLKETFPLLHESFKKGDFVVNHTTRRGSALPMDQALEKCYNKTAKGPGGVIGITQNKASVCRWNLIKHEKSGITNLLRELCHITEFGELSLHHEFGESTTRLDEECVLKIQEYIRNRCQPFQSSSRDIAMSNIVTGKQLNEEEIKFLLGCVQRGTSLYEGFKKTRLVDKSLNLLDKIPKSRKSKKLSSKLPKIDVKKETVMAIKSVEYARLRNFSISELLKCELTSYPFFLTEDGNLRKCTQKSELLNEIEAKLETPSPACVPVRNDVSSVVIIDFMAHARKIPTKKLMLRTFGDFAAKLWNRFLAIASNSSRIDIVFDIYQDDSIKSSERMRRQGEDAIVTIVSRDDQPLPVDMGRFWGSSANKASFELFLMNWVKENSKSDKIVMLGGSHQDDLFKCLKITPSGANDVPLLMCTHEEADDRILFHANHAITIESFDRVIVATDDTDVFSGLLHHFPLWSQFGLQELWMVCGTREKSRAIPVHDLINVLDSSVIEVLPAIHALSGSDTTSKIVSKKKVLHAAEDHGWELLGTFGKVPLDEEMMAKAEKFLIICLSNNDENDFDQLRFNSFHKQGFTMDWEKLPCTSKSIRKHIARSYLQCYRWYHAAFEESNSLDPLQYGYVLSNDRNDCLIPDVQIIQKLPDNFPSPCTCLKCVKSTVCPCRVKNLSCCDFCKCFIQKTCNNPKNPAN